MLREVVPLVLTPNSDLDPAMKARLLELGKMIDELERVIDLDAIFSNSKELGRAGCARKPDLREDHQLLDLREDPHQSARDAFEELRLILSMSKSRKRVTRPE
jgi:hypothetical protein